MTFVDLLRVRNIPFKSASRQGELWINCPFCEERGEPGPDTKFRLGLNYITNQGHCFRCDWATSTTAVANVTNKLIGAHTIISSERPVEEKPIKIKLPQDFTLLSDCGTDDDLEVTAYQYLLTRGIGKAVMKAKKIGVSLTGRYAYRILFPVYWLGKLKGIVARDFTGTAQAKYINSPGEKYIYNLHPDLVDTVVLSEGIFKALAIEREVTYQMLNVGSSALLGHSITELMIKQLSYIRPKEVVLWPDPDKVGQEGILEVAEQLKDLTYVSLISPVPNKQADELPSGEIMHRFKARVPYSSQLQRQTRANLAFRR